MVTSWQMYWLTRFDYLQAFFGLTGGITMVGMAVWAFACGVAEDKFQKKAVIPFFIGVFFCLIASFIPTSKEMAAILIIPKMVNNEKIQELPNNIIDLVNAWIKELKPKGESK